MQLAAKKDRARLHAVSLAVCPLRIVRKNNSGEVIGSALATGFLWKNGEEWFLVTNWHNVTGVNADTDKLGGFIPNSIQVGLKENWELQGQKGGRAVVTDLDLYVDGAPIWFEHPLRREVDCVAIPINIGKNTANRALNLIEFHVTLSADVGMDCFIVGYPRGLVGVGKTPIWKRGSIATEPDLDHDQKPLILVDTATREGMSGSPVLIRHSGIHMPSGKMDDISTIGTVENFFGVYSGRVGADELGVQLGRVWKSIVIEQILSERRRGVDPTQAS